MTMRVPAPIVTGPPLRDTIGAPSALRRASVPSRSRTVTTKEIAPGSSRRRSSAFPPAFLISTISTPPVIAGVRAIAQRICASGRPNMSRSAGFALASPGAPCTSRPKPSR